MNNSGKLFMDNLFRGINIKTKLYINILFDLGLQQKFNWEYKLAFTCDIQNKMW